MSSATFLVGLFCSFPAPAAFSAQAPGLLLRQNDTIVGMGALEALTYAQIDDARTWIALVDTSADAARDFAILRNGFVTLREGATLFAPANTSIDEFDSLHLSAAGHLALCLRVSTSGVVREALYWNTLPVALQDSPLVSPLVGAGTVWSSFDSVKMSRANQIFVVGDVQNPANGTGRDATLCRFTLDSTGTLVDTQVLLTKGQFVPAMETTVSDLPNGEHALAINERGSWLTVVQGVGGTSAYLLDGETAVARQGFAAPVAGRVWGSLVNSPRVWLNDRGQYAFTGSMGGTDGYLVVTGERKFAQAGEVYPSFSAGALETGTGAPLVLANDGNLFWRADSALGEDAFLRNYVPILQQGHTLLDGDLVVEVEPTEGAFGVSRNGRFFVGRVRLQSAREAAVLVDFGLVLPLAGCAGNEGELALASGLALPGGTLELTLDHGPAAGALPTLFLSTRERLPGSECGVNTPFGELLISPGQRVGSFTLPAWDGTSPSTLLLPIPADLALVDQVFFAQAVFHDVTGASTPAFALTNGLRIEIGAP